MKNLLSAIQFITIIPVGKNNEYNPVGMIPCFPVVGFILGFFLALFDLAASFFWPLYVVSVLDVFFLVVVTGAFHIDGLGDAADGLFSHRSKERKLEIMKDSSIGVMGLVAIISGLSLKVCGISALSESGIAERFILLMIIPAYARAAMLFGIKKLEYGRKEGTGHDHFEKPLEMKSFKWVSLPVIFSFFLGLKGLFINLAFIVVVLMIIRLYRKTIGCITGDMLGAMTEVTEASLFLLSAICFK